LTSDDKLVKWASDTFYTHNGDMEYAQTFFESVAPAHRKHFPMSALREVAGRMMCVQERISVAVQTNAKQHVTQNFVRQLITVIMEYDLGDMHNENWGYRESDKDTPVIFDVGYRVRSKRVYAQNIKDGISHVESLKDALCGACVHLEDFACIPDVDEFLSTITV